MKISIVSEHASPLALLGDVDAGGQNVHVASLAEALAKRGHDVVVHTRRDDPALPRRVPFSERVVVDHVDAGPPIPTSKDELLPYMTQFADDLEHQWSIERPDIVHAHYWMSGLAAVRAGDRVNVPVALTYHALGAEKRTHQGAQDTSPDARIEVESWLARVVELVIATTAAECRHLVSLGADAGRVAVVPCGVDLARFGPIGETWPAPRPDAGTTHRVVSVSRLVPRKGLADVIEAVAGLPHVELLIAGGPPAAMLGDDRHATELSALADRLGIQQRVRLLGSVDHDRIPALLRSADVVCCAPWYEPFGMVAVEAMACGVPVVATAVGGLAETVVDGTTGILVPPRRPASIASAVRALTDRPSRRDAMGASATRRAARYSWSEIARRTEAALERTARSGRTRSAPAEPDVLADTLEASTSGSLHGGAT